MHITRPILTEKTLALAGGGWYTFAVTVATSKKQVAYDIHAQYNVDVRACRTIHMPQKTRRVGSLARPVHVAAWKKILVRLSKGQTISVFDAATSQKEGGVAP